MNAFFSQVADGSIEAIGVRPACPEPVREEAAARAQAAFGTALPEEYLLFLATSNGFLSGNDLIVYYVADPASSKDYLRVQDSPTELFQANEHCHGLKLPKGSIALGENDLGLFVYDPKTAEYKIVDSSSFEEFDAYDSFEELLLAAAEPA